MTASMDSDRAVETIAYLTSLPVDPFFVAQNDPHERKQYTFMAWDDEDTGTHYECYAKGYTWGLQSKGPILQDQSSIPYDATNGTNSLGVVIRTNKGEYHGEE